VKVGGKQTVRYLLGRRRLGGGRAARQPCQAQEVWEGGHRPPLQRDTCARACLRLHAAWARENRALGKTEVENRAGHGRAERDGGPTPPPSLPPAPRPALPPRRPGVRRPGPRPSRRVSGPSAPRTFAPRMLFRIRSAPSPRRASSPAPPPWPPGP
jgi:hypothetical protein